MSIGEENSECSKKIMVNVEAISIVSIHKLRRGTTRLEELRPQE